MRSLVQLAASIWISSQPSLDDRSFGPEIVLIQSGGLQLLHVYIKWSFISNYETSFIVNIRIIHPIYTPQSS
jgi:hypothetical protein